MIQIQSFDFHSPDFKKQMKSFVAFHRRLYNGEEKYIPILDYEYTGLKLAGITGFLEPSHLFYKHAKIIFFVAYKNGEMAGRCVAFVNHRHNEKWKDKVGFFGLFETINDEKVAQKLLVSAAKWLAEQGMTHIRGPQNFPVNEATPGLLTEGFDSRPVVYYHFNYPYYQKLIEGLGFKAVKRVKSWEVPVQKPMEEKLERLSQILLKKYNITMEFWDDRPYKIRRKEMLEIYNDAWEHNFGFVPFTEEEFYSILDDMKLIMDKQLFLFLYVDGEPAAFFGGVPNINEKLEWLKDHPKMELLRALNLILNRKRTKGFRLGYLGVRQKYQGLGLPALMLWKEKLVTQKLGYEYCDLGWVLEDNVKVISLAELMEAVPSKTYTIYEMEVDKLK